MNIFERVSNWNEARYPQVYNWNLQLQLLTEEFVEEFMEATTEVDKLDALCDMSFVALGGLWKAKLHPQEFEHVDKEIYKQLLGCETIADLCQMMANYLANYEKKGADKSFEDNYVINTAAYIFADLVMNTMELDTPRKIIALSIVCDSNDSKAVKRTAPGVKANIDKGAGFVPPEARLQALLDTRWTGA